MRTEANETAERIEATLRKLPTENIEPAEPMEPMDATEPMEPIDRTEPVDPMESKDPVDRMDHLEVTSDESPRSAPPARRTPDSADLVGPPRV